MPAISEKERRAMYAAASGHSTLGIPDHGAAAGGMVCPNCGEVIEAEHSDGAEDGLDIGPLDADGDGDEEDMESKEYFANALRRKFT